MNIRKKTILFGILISFCMTLVVVTAYPLLPDGWTNGTSSMMLDDDEKLLFFPSMAEYDRKQHVWRISVHVWVHEPEMESVKRNALIAVFKNEIGLSDNDPRSEHFESMARYLMVDQEGGRDVAVSLGGKHFRLGTTDRNGHARAELYLDGHGFTPGIYRRGNSRFIPVTARIMSAVPHEVTGAIRVIERGSIMVISDIDDTIKISGVGDKKELLKNTFLKPFKPVPGMARLYRKIAFSGAVFHYVSASLWQLYRPLAGFLDEAGFPGGLFYMKRFGLSQNFSTLFADSGSVKMPHVSELLARFKDHRFILIGDSGESDPEMYGECARRTPGSVAGIYVRNVNGEARNSPRMKKAFRNLPDEKWTLFIEATEIEKDIMRRISGERR